MRAPKRGRRLARLAAHVAQLASSPLSDLMALFEDVIPSPRLLREGLGDSGRLRVFSPLGHLLGLPVPGPFPRRLLPDGRPKGPRVSFLFPGPWGLRQHLRLLPGPLPLAGTLASAHHHAGRSPP
jgi:hypothetical protein